MALTESTVDTLRDEGLAALSGCPPNTDALDRWEATHLGRDSALARCRRGIAELDPAERPAVGRRLAEAVRALNAGLAEHRRRLPPASPHALRFDPTVPPPAPARTGLHPLTSMTEDVVGFFARHGFSRRESRQLEDVRHSFDLLGVPGEHPLRTPRHTFFTAEGDLLRSHTTASALRVLGEQAGPGRFVVDGACHRNTVPSARNTTQFHSVEAVAAGLGVRLSDLKGLALGLVDDVLDGSFAPRLRYHRAVPYVSPGVAVEVACRICRQAGCDFCFGTGLVEVMSGGLLTREVLDAVGLGPDLRAFALSISVERVLALRHRIADIRVFLRNDVGVLAQFH